MATTAEELRRHIEEYLDTRIRSKSQEDRTEREKKLLATLEDASDDLLMQGNVKRRQQLSALESMNERQLTRLLEISTETKRLRRAVEDMEEGE